MTNADVVLRYLDEADNGGDVVAVRALAEGTRTGWPYLAPYLAPRA